MQKIVLTGGFGFVGKNLIEYFSKNYDVVVLDKKIDINFINFNPVKYHQFDLTDQKYLKSILFQEKPDFIINLISHVTTEREINLFDKLIDTNFKTFLSIYQSSKDLKNFKLLLNLGSAEEYGPIPSPYKETDREEPSSPYALVKQLTTNTAIMLNRNNNYPVCVIRPGNLFGKYQEMSKIIPYIISKLKKNEDLYLTNGDQERDYLDIQNFCYNIELLIKNYKKVTGEIINISSGISYSIKEIVEKIKQELESTSKINYGAIPYRENEMMHFCCDISKRNYLLNDKSDINVFESLSKYIRKQC